VLTQQVDYERGLREFVERSFRHRMPALIDFTLRNQTVVKLVRHLRLHTVTGGSPATAYQYVYGVWRYSQWLRTEPDNILRDCWGADGDPLPKMLRKHEQLVDDFAGHLQEQDRELAPGTIANHVKGVRALYRASRLQLEIPPYPRTVLYPNQSPTPEELERVQAIADIRERCIVDLLALGGQRTGTTCQLRVGHVRAELEHGVLPVLVRIEPAITKGKGWGRGGHYTFLGREAVEDLKTYLEIRRKGSRNFPPENLQDDSPLIRNGHDANRVRPITPNEVWHIVHKLYVKAGILVQCVRRREHRKGSACESCGWPNRTARRHRLGVHSLRYYFRTQLTALGVNVEYVEFMMGRSTPLYHDIQSKGVEFHRQIYRAADLSIKPRTKAGRLELLKELVRGFGLDPEKVLVKEALSEPHRSIVSQGETYEAQITALAKALRHSVIRDLSNASKADSARPE